jgi:diaminopimelate epimerase
MSGAGNDFVIFDARKISISLTSKQIQKISDRKNIGCDQLIVIRNSTEADCLIEIYNSDGSLSGACGNATRCVAAILFSEKKSKQITIKTAATNLKCWLNENNLISVDMGIPDFHWQKIPLSYQENSQKISLFDFDFACVNIGNPHAVTFVEQKISDEKFFTVGPQVETNAIFPQKTNVEFAQILSDNLIEVRVWERGAGETLACGSGACAVAILAIKHGLVKSKKITTRFKGGDLAIEWNDDNSGVVMTGGYQKIFAGTIDASFF